MDSMDVDGESVHQGKQPERDSSVGDDAPKQDVLLTIEVIPEQRINKFEENGTELTDPYDASEFGQESFPFFMIQQNRISLLTSCRDVLPDEKFVQQVRQLELVSPATLKQLSQNEPNGELKDKEKEAKDKDKEDDPFNSEWHKQRVAVEHHLGRAQDEISRLIDLLQMLDAGVHAQALPFLPPDPTAYTQLNALLVRIMSKKKQLESSGVRLSEASQRLRAQVESGIAYVDEVARLRKEWRITSPRQLSGAYLPLFMVDYAYNADGSLLQAAPVLLDKGVEGNIELQIPRNLLGKFMRIGDWRLSSLPLPLFNESEALLYTSSDTASCEAALIEAQSSLFSFEIFDLLSKAAADVKLPGIVLMETMLRLESNSSDPISIRLLEYSAPAAAQRSKVPNHLSNWKSMSSEIERLKIQDMSTLTSREHLEQRRYTLVAASLAKAVRDLHRRKMETDHKLRTTKEILRNESLERAKAVLHAVVTLYRHLCLRDAIFIELVDLAARLGAEVSVVPTYTETVSAFEFKYDLSMILSVIIRENSIDVGANIELDSPVALSSYIAARLCELYFTSAQSVAAELGLPFERRSDRIARLGTSTQTIDLLVARNTRDEPINVQVRRSDSNEPSDKWINWNELPGTDTENKLRLLLTS